MSADQVSEACTCTLNDSGGRTLARSCPQHGWSCDRCLDDHVIEVDHPLHGSFACPEPTIEVPCPNCLCRLQSAQLRSAGRS